MGGGLQREGFAYVQAHQVHVWPQSHFAHLPADNMAVDAFVGEPDMLSRGHGAQFLRLLAERLLADGAPIFVIDPDVDNHRARRAHGRAGFRGDTVVDTDEGPAILMTRERAAGPIYFSKNKKK
jgi:aminoglycoside 6'-N-acetyltransferase